MEDETKEVDVSENSEKHDTKKESNPILEYFYEIFSQEHINELLNSLNDEQKKFIMYFVSGFETCLDRHIIGVYDTNYLASKRLTKEVIEKLNLNFKSIVAKSIGLNFTIVWTN